MVDGAHLFNGSHHAICSYFASAAALAKKTMVQVSIVELESRTRVMVYFQTKTHQASQECMIELSDGRITAKNIGSLTHTECVELLKKKFKVEWDEICAKKRFGTFYKYIVVSEDEETYQGLSEMINLQNIERYSSYFFE